MTYTGKFFKDYRVIIFENDSLDGSKDILSNWQQSNDKVKILSKDFGNNKRPNITFLAKARNFYLEELENNSQYNDFDMVMIVDLDMRNGWDIRGILHSFSHIEEWGAVCSNGIFSYQGTMWNVYALRNQSFSKELGDPRSWTTIQKQAVKEEQKIYPVNPELIPVLWRLTFYKRNAIYNCRYTSQLIKTATISNFINVLTNKIKSKCF